MAIAIRGTTPASAGANTPPSVSLTSTRQPQTDDVLLIICGNDWDQLADIGTPTVGGSTSGVTAVTNGSADGGQFFAHAKAWTKVITSGGSDLTVAFGTDGGVTDEEKCIDVYVFSGVDTSTPVDVAAGAFNSSGSTSHVAPSVTATVVGFLVCHVNDGNGASSGTSTPPSGMSEQYDSVVSGSMAHSGATLQLSGTGATGTKTFAKSGNATYAALSIVMKPAAGGSGATVSASVVAGTASVGSPTVQTGSTVAAAVVAGTATVGTPTVVTPVPAAVVAGVATVGTPAVKTGSTVAAATVAGAAAVGTTTVSTGSTVSAATVAGVATVGAASVTSNANVAPSTVAGAATVGTAAVTTITIVSASVVAGTASVGAPTVKTGSTVTAATAAAAATIPTPSVSAGGNATVSPNTAAAVATVGSPTVGAGSSTSPATVAGTATVGAPTVRTSVTVTLTTVAGVAAIASPNVIAGPIRNITFAVGRPRVDWHAGPPRVDWKAGAPRA